MDADNQCNCPICLEFAAKKKVPTVRDEWRKANPELIREDLRGEYGGLAPVLFRALKEEGLEMGEYLGAGGFAQCWTVKGKDFVAKVTSDKNELEAVKRLVSVDKKPPGVINIYSYRQFFDPEYQAEMTLTFAERLIPWEDWRYEACRTANVGVKNLVVPDLDKAFWFAPKNPFAFTALAACNLKAQREGMLAIGCTSFSDWKAANCLVRPGYGPVISDLGCSRFENPVSPDLFHTPPIQPRVKEFINAEPF